MLEFKGLKCMGKNPSKAKVLYIDVQEETGFLKEMAEAMSSYFIQQGHTLENKINSILTLFFFNIILFYTIFYRFIKKRA